MCSRKITSALFLSLLLLFYSPVLNAAGELLLRENLKQAKAGDYLVTAQGKNYTVLLIRDRRDTVLNIEEITIPMARVQKEKMAWREWIQKGAQGNTSWMLYAINLTTGKMEQSYSVTRHQSVVIPESQNFFSTLLNLKLQKIDESERKRVGPPPAADRADRRRLWQPPVIVDGKAVEGVALDAWRTRWPSDGGELSGKIIEVYLPHESKRYPAYFPYWLQISGIIGNAKVRIVDSGSGLDRVAAQQLTPVSGCTAPSINK